MIRFLSIKQGKFHFIAITLSIYFVLTLFSMCHADRYGLFEDEPNSSSPKIISFIAISLFIYILYSENKHLDKINQIKSKFEKQITEKNNNIKSNKNENENEIFELKSALKVYKEKYIELHNFAKKIRLINDSMTKDINIQKQKLDEADKINLILIDSLYYICNTIRRFEEGDISLDELLEYDLDNIWTYADNLRTIVESITPDTFDYEDAIYEYYKVSCDTGGFTKKLLADKHAFNIKEEDRTRFLYRIGQYFQST